MPEPTTWILRYWLITEDDANRCRHHIAVLLRDPHVDRVSFERVVTRDDGQVRVVFRPGFTQPRARELHALDKRFPDEIRPELEAPAPEQPVDDFVSDFTPRSGRIGCPAWVRPGAWARNKTSGKRYEIEALLTGDLVPSVRIHEWLTDADLKIGVPLTKFLGEHEACEQPVVGPSWYAHLLEAGEPT